MKTKTPAAKAPRLDEHALFARLQKGFGGREYVVLPQVRDKAGFAATRTGDALARSPNRDPLP